MKINIFFILIIYTFALPNPNCTSAYCSNCTINNPDNCFECIDNFLLIEGKCIYKTEKHCSIVLNNKCIHCESNYILDSEENNCIEGNDGCNQYDTDGDCLFCQEGYLLNETECIYCPENNHCIDFDSDCSTCIKCNSEYALINSTCTKPIQNCKQYRKEKCIKCYNGYYFDKEGHCQKGEIENCIEYETKPNTNSRTCIKCLKGYILERTTFHCVKITDEIRPAHCKEISHINNCSLCNPGYYMTEDHQCEQCSAGCEYCNNGTVCLECSKGYYLRKLTGKCLQIPHNDYSKCEYYSTSKVECSLYNTDCIYETVNDVGYCSYKGLNCSSWDSASRCIRCDSGHVLNQANLMSCKEKIEGCLTYGNKIINNVSEEVCIECNSNGYYLKEDFTCGKCDSVCLHGKCEYSSSNCLQFNCTDVTNVQMRMFVMNVSIIIK